MPHERKKRYYLLNTYTYHMPNLYWVLRVYVCFIYNLQMLHYIIYPYSCSAKNLNVPFLTPLLYFWCLSSLIPPNANVFISKYDHLSLHNILAMWPHVTFSSATTLVPSTIFSHLDYCTGLITGILLLLLTHKGLFSIRLQSDTLKK